MSVLAIGTFLVFLTLKLTQVIDWSYWWVTAPLWGLVVYVLLVLVPLTLISKRHTEKTFDKFFKDMP